VITLQCTNFRF